MEGELGKIPVESRCSAILCPPLTWNEFGKATSDSNSTCLPCDTNPTLFGQVTCGEVKTSREKEILDKIFAATGGRYWTKPHDNWMRPGVPICSREGIFCGGGALSNEGVLDIKLGGFGLRGEIPAELWEFSNLRALILTDNAVGIGFSGIENVQGLRVLKCSACQIRSLTGLRNAPPKLAEVHLARNQFEGFIPDEIYELNQVGALFLNNNHFAGRISSAIGEMTGLSRLELWDNRLTGGVPSELGLLSKLEYFSLSDNELSGAIPSQFEQLGQLVDVRMARQRGRAKLEGPLPTFENNEFLNQVDLSGNGFSGWLPPSFLSKIDPERQVEVDLSSNEFTGPFPEAWGRLESLNIDLSGNMISKLPDALCIKNGWNNGMVGLVNSCDAILCKPGTFGQAGRQTEPTQTCQSCPGGVDAAPFYGSRECLDPRLRAEREILVNFYQGTNGTSWLIQTDWASSRPTCMWFGVTCDDDGFIQELSLPTNWLKSGSSTMAAVSLIFTLSNLKVRQYATHSPSILKLSLMRNILLQVLDLKDNDVDLDFQQIPATSKLEFVRLSGIGLHSISGVSRASKLRALHVTNNLLTSIPDELYDMPTLESLFISFNSITGSLSTRLGQLKNIKELYMFGNHLTGTIPTVVGLLTELTDFVVASNFLSGELPDEFSSLPKLEQLSVYDQEGLELITGPVPSFSQAPNLW
jgi:Leucine-rich repeat (LRR) protein